MKILVVDDEQTLLDSIRRGLRSRGYEVVCSSDGGQALGLLDNEKDIDLLITDFAMPGMTGLDLLARVREEHGVLPVIMMTAYGDKQVVTQAIKERCDAFLDKPFTLERLLAEIKRLRDRVEENRAARTIAVLVPGVLERMDEPLRAISSLALEGLSSAESPDKLKSCLIKIIEHSDIIKSINNDMVHISRSLEPGTEVIDLVEILLFALASIGEAAGTRGVEVVKLLPEGPVNVRVNRGGLERTFKELFANALEAMEGAYIKELRVEAAVDACAGHAVVSISDTGCGILEEDRAWIFSPGFTRKEGAAGLGLAVARLVLSRHGGDIRVESRPGEGSTFLVNLPV